MGDEWGDSSEVVLRTLVCRAGAVSRDLPALWWSVVLSLS
jgi:hypothetical protein